MDPTDLLVDPLNFVSVVWPDIALYDKQVEVLYSVQNDLETYVPAGNKLGKDFVAAIAALWFFCSRRPCRVVTSSSSQNQLKSVLWGEIRQLIRSAKHPLPIQENDLLLRQVVYGALDPKSYVIGIVSNEPENLQGHHLPRYGKPRTLWVADEASSIGTEYYNAADTWAHRKLIIGNPLPCSNFFFSGVKRGSVSNGSSNHMLQRVIKIKAEDSPNVKLAARQIELDKQPSGEELVPGVIDWETYQLRRRIWDKVRQTIGLDGDFYEGAEVLLYPPDWLNRAEQIASTLEQGRNGVSLGIDPAEGGDSTTYTVVDWLGVIAQISKKTPNTAVVTGETIALGDRYGVPPGNWVFDRGGGGKQHADRLREQGYTVRTVGFGESPTDENKLRKTRKDRKQDAEQRTTYANRRAEMYGRLRFEILDPEANPDGFGIPAELVELRRQLAILPLQYDNRGRLYLPKKEELIADLGHSPDEADSLVLAIWGLLNPPRQTINLRELWGGKR